MYAKDRDMDFPLLVCGGPCAFNVEPIADFFDIVPLGESEEWAMNSSTPIRLKKAKGFLGGKEAFCVKRLKFWYPLSCLIRWGIYRARRF